MHAVPEGQSRWPWLVFAGLFCVFCSAFYLPLSSKATNNIFYAGLALPALFWLLWRPVALPVMARAFAWLVLLLGALVVLDAGDVSGLKKGLYLMLFFVCCLMLEQWRWGVRGCVTVFACFSIAVLLFVLGDWLWIWSESGRWIRYGNLWGQPINPVYFSMLISSALVFIWLFHVADWLERRSRVDLLAGLFLLSVAVLLCASVFQSRSTLLGFALFFGAYLLYKRIIMLGLGLALALVVLLFVLGGDELLNQRGLSYRPAIWQDAWLRVLNDCGLWLGCGSDGYRFLGKFHHPHSGYLAMFYRNGLLGTLLFVLFAGFFFWRSVCSRSRWMLLALVGWGSLLTTTNGVLTTPQPLWIYFWLPTFMALLESQRPAVLAYFSARQAGVRNPGLISASRHDRG
jgi:hypothetical protein